MKSVEIFSGAGGLAKGLELAGFEHLAFVEWNKDACASLRANFPPEKVYCGDIQSYDFTQCNNVDVVAGGPPASLSLWEENTKEIWIRGICSHPPLKLSNLSPPDYLFLRMLKDYFGKVLLNIFLISCFASAIRVSLLAQTLIGELNSLLQKNVNNYSDGVRYNVSHRLVNAADYGVPQCRERVIIAGVRSDIDRKWQFPKNTF